MNLVPWEKISKPDKHIRKSVHTSSKLRFPLIISVSAPPDLYNILVASKSQHLLTVAGMVCWGNDCFSFFYKPEMNEE